MSTATALREPTLASEGEWVPLHGAPVPDDAPDSTQTTLRERRAQWVGEDPVEELIAELIHAGRSDEARRIRLVLRDAVHDESTLIKALVSREWAEDWDSEEDSVYDAL